MYTEEMLESIKKVEASRTSRIGKELRRMDADEKDNLLKEFHPDYKESGFATLKMGPNKGEKAPAELADLLQANSRVLGKDIGPYTSGLRCGCSGYRRRRSRCFRSH